MLERLKGRPSFTEVAFVPRYSSSTTGQFTWDAIWFCSHLEFVSLSDASVWRLTKIELIFCTTFYMQQQQARIGVSEMRGSYMVTLRLHVVTIVTPDRWVWSRYKAKYSHIGHTRLMWLRSQGSPFEGECAHSVWLHWSLESQPKNMTTVTMPQQRGDKKMSTPLVASWNGFRATECQWHCHDELFRWCYQWQSHWQLHVNWALVRKCLRVPFLMSLGGTGALLG